MSYLKACCLHDTCSMRMQGNWDRITKKYGGTQQGGFIRYVLTLVNLPPISISKSRTLLLPSISWTPLFPGDQFASNEKAAEFSRFFATRKKPEFERTLKQSLENVRVNARWIQGIRSEPRLAQTVQELLHRPWSAFGWVAGGVAGNKVPADGMRLYILSVKKVVSRSVLCTMQVYSLSLQVGKGRKSFRTLTRS